jgi:hypothetical protein
VMRNLVLIQSTMHRRMHEREGTYSYTFNVSSRHSSFHSI